MCFLQLFLKKKKKDYVRFYFNFSINFTYDTIVHFQKIQKKNCKKSMKILHFLENTQKLSCFAKRQQAPKKKLKIYQ